MGHNNLIKPILLLGNPKLYDVSVPVSAEDVGGILALVEDLHDTMMDFRTKYGRGRAIAAPQIGEMVRVVYMHIDEPVVFINPQLDLESKAMMEVWDDCMSFPELLVRVRRHETCRISYRDEGWKERQMDLAGDLSELLQHEVDHLDGVLAVQRAIDGKSYALTREKRP